MRGRIEHYVRSTTNMTCMGRENVFCLFSIDQLSNASFAWVVHVCMHTHRTEPNRTYGALCICSFLASSRSCSSLGTTSVLAPSSIHTCIYHVTPALVSQIQELFFMHCMASWLRIDDKSCWYLWLAPARLLPACIGWFFFCIAQQEAS